jgi:hypothetical protein
MWLTFAQWNGSTPPEYMKVLLVLPVSGSTQYARLVGKSAGIAWYGDYLYVADPHFKETPSSSEVSVTHIFDMRKIFRTTANGIDPSTGEEYIGLHNGTYYGANYGFVMPEVGRLTPSGSTNTTGLIGVDNSPTAPALVTSHYSSTATSVTAIRWPLSPTTKQLTNTSGTELASEAITVPLQYMQGITSHNGNWWFVTNDSNVDGHHDSSLTFWHDGDTTEITNYWLESGEGITYWPDASNPDLLLGVRELHGYRGVFTQPQEYYHVDHQ